MTQAPSFVDRLRIERAVWTVDTLAGDLPGRRRRSVRRELRADLWASTREVGAAEAIRRLGNLRRLSAEYLDVEYGAKRPRYLKGAFWAFMAVVVLEVHTFARIDGFHHGLEVADPGDGSFTLRPLGRFGPVYETAYVDGTFDSFSLDLAPALLPLAVVLLGAFLVGGRFWRAWRPGRVSAG